VCPSGVPYGRIIERGRTELERLRRQPSKHALSNAAMKALLPHPTRLRAFGGITRVAQKTGLARLAPMGAQLPGLKGAWKPPRDGVAPAQGRRKHRVAFLNGCVMPVMYADSHRATVALLRAAGCEVWFAPGQVCCGALFAHNGDLAEARRLRDRNSSAFGMEDFDYLVVNSAGCGSHLKDFYPNLGPRVRDLTEFLAEVGLPEAKREVNLKVTYQDACHLVHAQRISKQPRDLIRSVPGVELVEMRHPDICCGSAGIYNVLEPEMSGRILDEKMDDLLTTGADLVVTANPGCQMQLEAGLRRRKSSVPVRHLAELLAESFV
jgi:glycolate oxidase iron-sulfur subunit